MSKLAIDGGTPVFAAKANVPVWPPADEKTAELLKEIYLSHAWSFYGKHEVAFNEEFAAYTGAASCAMMANGTVTLEVAMQALGIGPGDEVIVPSYTWIATGTAVVVVGATPVVVDIEPDTYCIDPVEVEKAITPKTRAIIPVHLYGSMADMDKIMTIAARHGLKVVEDCAHAHGGKWNGKGLGSFGDIGSFSFQQSKIMTAGEGGLCTTDDEDLYDRIGRYSHIGYGLGAKQGKPTTPPPMDLDSRNYRATDFQAVILQDQLATLEEDSRRRAANAEYLHKELRSIPGISTQQPGRCATMQQYYVYGITVDPAALKEGKTRDDVIAAVTAEGATNLFAGWGEPAFRQRLFQVSPDRYRVASSAVVEDIIHNRIILGGIQWLDGDRSNCEKLVEVFRKVMQEYGR